MVQGKKETSETLVEKFSLEKLHKDFQYLKKKSVELRAETVSQRIRRLKALRTWVLNNRDTIAEAVYKDFKKPKVEAEMTESYVVLSELNQAIKNLNSWSKPKPVPTPVTYVGSTASVHYEPKGVCLIISPWNFPFNLAVGPLVSAIAAGNAVMLKPSEITVHTANLIESMCKELFEDSEVVVVQGGVKETTELLKLPFDHIFFTGSPKVGKIVMKAAAENLSSITLELGGKSPLVIDENAKISDVASKLVWGKFINNGQTCIAPDYVLVPKKKKTELIEQIRVKINDYFNSDGEGIDKSKDYARIINATHFDRMVEFLEDAINKGADLEAGGKHDKRSLYFEPTVLSNIPHDSRIYEEEIFGPILPVMEYDELAEAIHIINAKPKPLALYIFSNSADFVRKLNRQIPAGTECVNDCVIHFLHPYLPFGGVNNSGIGKSHGYYGFLAFSNEKPVLKQRSGVTALKPLYPPYSGFVKGIVDVLLKHF